MPRASGPFPAFSSHRRGSARSFARSYRRGGPSLLKSGCRREPANFPGHWESTGSHPSGLIPSASMRFRGGPTKKASAPFLALCPLGGFFYVGTAWTQASFALSRKWPGPFSRGFHSRALFAALPGSPGRKESPAPPDLADFAPTRRRSPPPPAGFQRPGDQSCPRKRPKASHSVARALATEQRRRSDGLLRRGGARERRDGGFFACG